ncbi:MAG: T9SS type A sorting domain-containing protein [Ignavibacteriae bacterium]|nr:T9SS type A sorting domain-containing protein [Ignavibacteriota bacterium]
MKTLNKIFRFGKILIIIILISALKINAQTQVFTDNFSSGTTNWVLTGNWGLTTSNYYSASNSLAESPSGDYTNIQSTSATSINIDLSSYQGAEFSFWAKYNLENAFDYVYVEISKDGGTSFVKLTEFTGVSSTWQKYTFNIGTFAGNTNVKIRFRFYSDQYIVADGIYIDDVEILGSTIDNSAPLIVHDGPQFYEGTQNNNIVIAEITDVSGINSSTLFYNVDGVGPNSVTGINTSGNNYSFTIPAQNPGSMISYKIKAVDNASSPNQTDTSIATQYKYISGTYLAYDDGIVDAVATTTGTAAVAVKISVSTNMYGRLVYALIRNYRDSNLSNSNMLFHVWSNNNGVPGTDLITPFSVTPEATLDNPFPFTRIDLRNYTELHDLQNDFFIGYTVPVNSVSMVVSNVSHGRSYSFNGTTWSAYSKDYEMRAIIFESSSPLPVELTSFSANVEGNKILLNWETATEVNNYGFEIEKQKSEVSSKNLVWEKVGFVEGSGNSNSPKYYFYEDQSLKIAGKYFYRLKQIDIDGKYEYSDEIEVNISAPEEFNLSQNYPNPFNPVTTIKYQIPAHDQNDNTSALTSVRLNVFDVLGKEISTLVNEKQNPGNYEISFDGSNLPSGIYFYTLQMGRLTKTQRMILLK